jgi:hypothetical protein
VRSALAGIEAHARGPEHTCAQRRQQWSGVAHG